MWHWFFKGGVIMYPLLLCSVATLGIIIERLWSFPGLLRQGRQLVQDSTLNPAEKERYAERIVRQLQQGLGILDVVVTASPMLGLLGTVFGVIRSFQSLGGDAAGVSIANVGKGLSEALVCTATGLTIAITALVAYHLFRQKIDSFIDGFNDGLGEEERPAC
ncbi:MAG TPA: MotA/TolQ/ExbB proton channel family protein [Bacillota bacterium]|nr:MotA/TolQ/ExbB proton channel family protein [Bacillota bacterium]